MWDNECAYVAQCSWCLEVSLTNIFIPSSQHLSVFYAADSGASGCRTSQVTQSQLVSQSSLEWYFFSFVAVPIRSRLALHTRGFWLSGYLQFYTMTSLANLHWTVWFALKASLWWQPYPDSSRPWIKLRCHKSISHAKTTASQNVGLCHNMRMSGLIKKFGFLIRNSNIPTIFPMRWISRNIYCQLFSICLQHLCSLRFIRHCCHCNHFDLKNSALLSADRCDRPSPPNSHSISS